MPISARFVAATLLAVFTLFACSSGRDPPLLTEGLSPPVLGPTGATGASGGGSAGPDADDAGPGAGPADPVPPCTQLLLCCNSFVTEDPAQAWCEETYVDAMRPSECEGFLTYFGC